MLYPMRRLLRRPLPYRHQGKRRRIINACSESIRIDRELHAGYPVEKEPFLNPEYVQEEAANENALDESVLELDLNVSLDDLKN